MSETITESHVSYSNYLDYNLHYGPKEDLMKLAWSTVGTKFLAMENALPTAQQQTRTLTAFAQVRFTQFKSQSHRQVIHGHASEL